MDDSTGTQRSSRRRLLLILSVSSLAAAGIIAALGILLGGDTWKSIATAGLIFALNLLVLVSFTAAHSWLKILQRSLAAIAVGSSLFFLWADVPYYWEYESEPIPILAVLRDWSGASWIAASVASLLCLLSLTWKYLNHSGPLKLAYSLSFGFGLGSAAIFSFEAGMSSLDSYGIVRPSLTLLGSALAVLAAAASLIVLIAALVERSRRKQIGSEAVSESVPAIDLRSEIRAELRDLAFTGELIDIMLQNPMAVKGLKRKLGVLEAQKTDGTDDADFQS